MDFSLTNGEQAAEIVQLILDHGKLPPPAIYSSLVLQDAKGDTAFPPCRLFD
jgi:hypothetical protein